MKKLKNCNSFDYIKVTEKEAINTKCIADSLNKCFTNIGHKFARKIDISKNVRLKDPNCNQTSGNYF